MLKRETHFKLCITGNVEHVLKTSLAVCMDVLILNHPCDLLTPKVFVCACVHQSVLDRSINQYTAVRGDVRSDYLFLQVQA